MWGVRWVPSADWVRPGQDQECRGDGWKDGPVDEPENESQEDG